jgi:hypothetical protein
MKVISPGHVYTIKNLGKGSQRIKFVKRSGGAVKYRREWPGLQTQEVLRVVIDRTKYLDSILSCTETQDALWHLRMALYQYEVRAWRRKQEKVNRKQPAHDDTIKPHPWREHPHDVPFNEQNIELRPIGSDGHIIVKGSKYGAFRIKRKIGAITTARRKATISGKIKAITFR